MVSAAFSVVTMQDFEPDSRGYNKNSQYKTHKADELSSEAISREEDAGRPLKYHYPQSISKYNDTQSKQSELGRGQARTKAQEVQLDQMTTGRPRQELAQ